MSNIDKRQSKLPRITFGMIVLNGEPFIRYNLRALYPVAHEIIVVEGASRFARSIADDSGHSRDGTLETLKAFQREEEGPVKKLFIVTAEDEGHPDGFWPEKDEMSQAYAKRATGDYLWQIDVDEFYMPEDMQTICEILTNKPEIKVITFPMLTFWGDLDYLVDGFYLRNFSACRVFAWKPGYRYTTHRPPTVVDEKGVDLRKYGYVTNGHMRTKKIYMYHYELLLPKQAYEKTEYYGSAQFFKRIHLWFEYGYTTLNWPFHPHMVYRYPSWLVRYRGEHPPQVKRMMTALKACRHPGIQVRNNNDVERLLNSRWYQASCRLLEKGSLMVTYLFPVLSSLLNFSRGFRKFFLRPCVKSHRNKDMYRDPIVAAGRENHSGV
jgi:hypothetical protein